MLFYTKLSAFNRLPLASLPNLATNSVPLFVKRYDLNLSRIGTDRPIALARKFPSLVEPYTGQTKGQQNIKPSGRADTIKAGICQSFLTYSYQAFPGFLMKNKWLLSPIAGCLLALGSLAPVSIARANTELPVAVTEQLSLEQKTDLENGSIVITGTQGQYVARTIVEASIDNLWAVLTDYNNLSEFLPNLVSSKIIESEGNTYLVEQVSEQRILLFKIESTLLTENILTENQRIDFKLVEGDLSQFEGNWTIEQISNSVEGGTPKFLLTQSIDVKPDRGTPQSLFYDIFEKALEKTLTALRDEVHRRQSE